ncbi:MAG: lipid A biosynthesis lauroyl acyltransferase [Alphaproteobacteria bacterium]
MMKRLFRRLVRTDWFYLASANLLRVMTRAVRWMGRPRTARVMRAIFRTIGPVFPEHRTAKANIAAAFPEKSEAERHKILKGCWDNMALVVSEFVFLEEVAQGFDPNDPSNGAITVEGIDRFIALRDDGKPAIIIAAHLANWEVLGVIATKFGLETVLPYRAPGNLHLAEDVLKQREALMGRLVPNRRGAAFVIATALEKGAHLGMLVDQRLGSGIVVPFFDRPAWTNPLAAKFARQFDCPVHGARTIRRPDGGLHLELTAEIDMPRDGEGRVDVARATARITEIVEGWVRDHPEQYFWLHDRWKMS